MLSSNDYDHRGRGRNKNRQLQCTTEKSRAACSTSSIEPRKIYATALRPFTKSGTTSSYKQEARSQTASLPATLPASLGRALVGCARHAVNAPRMGNKLRIPSELQTPHWLSSAPSDEGWRGPRYTPATLSLILRSKALLQLRKLSSTAAAGKLRESVTSDGSGRRHK